MENFCLFSEIKDEVILKMRGLRKVKILLEHY